MKFVDCALARRMEAAEDEAQLAIAAVLQQQRPQTGAEALAIAGGHAVFAGANSPVGRAIALGLAGPVSGAEVDEVEAFYRRHGAPAQFDVTPLTHESLLAQLLERRYAATELNNVLARHLSPGESFPEEVDGIEFRPCAPQQAQLWTQTMLHGFFADAEIPAGWDELLYPMAVVPNGMAVIAWEGEQPVAAAGGLICPQWKLVTLGGTSTLPSHRGRGIQTAAIGRRLNAGIRAGCDLAVVVTRAGTVSQRNAEKMGFSVAYTKPTLVGPKA